MTYLAHSTEPEQCLLYTTTTSSSLSSPAHKKEAIKARDPDPLNYLVTFQKKYDYTFMYRRPILCTLYGAVDFLNVLKKYIMYL
jgi:hypothetical protein